VAIVKKANIYYDGKVTSRTIEFEDGSVKSLGIMLPGEYACYVRSGFNGGIDVFFGTEFYGFIPQNGSLIEVEYLLSDGSLGDILNPTVNEWKIEGLVEFVEPLGSETYLHVDINGIRFIGKSDGHRLFSIGDKLKMAMDLNHLHIFDKKSSLALY